MPCNNEGLWIEQELPGVFLMTPFQRNDERGCFVKTFHAPSAMNVGIEFNLTEEYFSISRKNVIRGMHFQNPPHAVGKIVYCIRGAVRDVLLDLRKNTRTYRKHMCIELNQLNRAVVYIPPGIAHGFISLEDDSCLVYKTDEDYAPDHDDGVRWDSFGFSWGNGSFIISKRDAEFLALDDYQSKF